MKKHIFQISNKGERSFLIVYSLFSFFLGVFISTFDIWAHVSFFSRFGYKYLASSYIASGLLGMAIVYLFTVLFRHLHARQLAVTGIGLSTILVLLVFGTSFFISEKIGAYLGMVVFFPLNMLLLLVMWRYGRMQIYGKATQKVFQYIKVSNYAGIAVGGFSVLISVFHISFFELRYFIVFSLLALWLFIGLLNKAIRYYPEYKTRTRQEPVQNKAFLFTSSRYTKYLYLFAVLSAVVGFSVHFAFMNAAWAGFFTILGLTKFYGLFIGLAIVMVFGVDRFIIKRVLYAYDSPYGTVILPFMLFAALLIAVVGYFLLGNIQPHEHFTLFFLLLSMVNVTYQISLLTVQKPALRTLFHSLDIRFRKFVDSRIEGLAPMLGLAISGIVILGLSFLKFYSLTIVLFFSMAITLLWGWFGIKLIREYRDVQENILLKLRYKKIGATSGNFSERSRSILSKSNTSQVKAVLELTKMHQPLVYEDGLGSLLRHPSADIRKYVIACIERDKVDSAVPELKKLQQDTDSQIAQVTDRVVRTMDIPGASEKNEEVIKQQVYNGSIEERTVLSRLIADSNLPEADGLLTNLSKDPEPKVRHAAVKAMVKRGNKHFSYSLIDFLYPAFFDAYAIDSIALSGDMALEYLERESNIPGIQDIVLSRIMHLYGKIGSERSLDILLGKLSSLNGYNKEQGIQALLEQRFQAGKSNALKLNSYIVKLCSIITENLSISNKLKGRGYPLLYTAYQLELQKNYKQLFQLLSLLYNPNIIEALQKYFMSGSRSLTSHGMELADQYIESDIKPLVFLLFEDIPLEEKLKKLEFYFPQPKLSINEIIRLCLTHDYSSLSLFPRACAMMEIYYNNLQEFSEELIFNSEHPEKLLHETAMFVLQKLHPEKMSLLLQEAPQLGKTQTILPSDEASLLVTNYKSLLELEGILDLSEFVLLQLADIVKKVPLQNKQDYLLLSNGSHKYGLLACSGKIHSEEKNIEINLKGQLVPILLLTEEGHFTLKSGNSATIWLFENASIPELIYDNSDLAKAVLNGIEQFKILQKNA